MIPQKMQCRISLKFDKIFIPHKTIRAKYPQSEAQVLTLTDILSNEKETIKLTFMTIVGKKYKKIAKGEIIVHQRFLSEEKKSLQKWIDLTLFQRYFENLGNSSEIVRAERNSGKIQLDIKCLDAVNLKKESTTKDQAKDALRKNKSNKGSENRQENLDDVEQEIRKEDIFDDDLSDHSISIIDEEEQKSPESMEGVLGEEVNKLAELFNANSDAILPKNPTQLKELNQILLDQCKTLSENYKKNLNAINSSNEKIRVQAKSYYEKYKEAKKELYKERVAFKEKTMALSETTSSNVEQYKKAFQEINECKTNLASFQSKLGGSNNTNSSSTQAEDINAMNEILKHIHNLGYNIFAGLSDDQKKQLKTLVNVEEHEEPKQIEEESLKIMKEDIELGNTIVGLIERVANDLFPKNLIGNIKIDQLNAITYKFDDDTHSKEVTLRIAGNNTLLTETGETFENWLLIHFGINTK